MSQFDLRCPRCQAYLAPNRCGDICERCEASPFARVPQSCVDADGHEWVPDGDGDTFAHCATCGEWRWDRDAAMRGAA